jgi:hypothetical protein
LINMAGSAFGDGPANRPPAIDAAQAEDSTSPFTPQSNAAFSSFQAINRANGGHGESGRQSRDASARGTPQADAPNLKSSEATSYNVVKASAQPEQLDSSGTYGTRSRRGGKERLNYAEDQDADFDFTSAATTTSSKKSASAAANTQSTTDSKRAKESAQLVTTNGAHSSAHNQTVAKDPAPGATSNATNPKKRKAAGTATPTTLASTPPVSTALSAATMRKQLPSSQARETNMLSFSKSEACLNKKGELVADDGTKLNINGKRPARIPFLGSSLLALFAQRGSKPYTPQKAAFVSASPFTECLRLT